MFVFFVLSLLCLTATAQQFCGVGQTLFDSKCLQFFPVDVDFRTAESICATSSGHLVSIPNSTYNHHVASLARKHTNGRFWIGAKASGGNVTDPTIWDWTDDSNFVYRNYQDGEPVSHGIKSCMRMNAESGQWLTGHCDRLRLPFACEYSPQIATTFPTLIAPKCREIPLHCNSGWTYFHGTGACYKNFVRRSTFLDAQGTCIAYGGELASIMSTGENNFIVELTKVGHNVKKGEVWIGLVNRNCRWQWTDNKAVGYTNWGRGEPNNRNKEFMTVLQPDKDGLWNNVGPNNQRAFVCKNGALH